MDKKVGDNHKTLDGAVSEKPDSPDCLATPQQARRTPSLLDHAVKAGNAFAAVRNQKF